MKWPQNLDYIEAIQHPSFCFGEPSLKAGAPVCDRFGVPRAAAGNFACVFQVVSGRERWAVRCFTRAAADVRRRYATLTGYLARHPAPWLVDFSYLEQGIRIRGNWYPVVRMAWVEGVTLSAFVASHLQNLPVLRQLARNWDEVAQGLATRRIAHGDLQHGNILVTPDSRIRLVDYDAMYVPPFRGEPSPELGHPNWQHPRRTERDYDEHLDAFSALVTSVSLAAVAADPGLWRFHNGENLLFSRPDFEAPRDSPVFAALLRSSDRNVSRMTRELEASCTGRPGRVRLAPPPQPQPRSATVHPSDDRPPEGRAPRVPVPRVGVESGTPAARPSEGRPTAEEGASELRPWAGAGQLYAVASALLPKLFRIAWVCLRTLVRLPFARPMSAPPAGGATAPEPAWWQARNPANALPTDTPLRRIRARMIRDRDFALLIWVCVGCGTMDVLLGAWWWLRH